MYSVTTPYLNEEVPRFAGLARSIIAARINHGYISHTVWSGNIDPASTLLLAHMLKSSYIRGFRMLHVLEYDCRWPWSSGQPWCMTKVKSLAFTSLD